MTIFHSIHLVSSQEEVGELKISASETTPDEEGSHAHDLVDGPDTSSFTAFLYSFLSSTDSGENANSHGQKQNDDDKGAPDDDNNNPLPDSSLKENGGRKSLFSRSKQSLGRAVRRAVRIGGFRRPDRKDNLEMKFDGDSDGDDGHGSKISGVEMRVVEPVKQEESSLPVLPLDDLPEVSEPSLLLSDSIRNTLYASLPPLMHGRKGLLLYRYIENEDSLADTRFCLFCYDVPKSCY